jgi:hypothetical protein
MLSYGFLDVVFSPYNDYWCEMHKLFNRELLSMRRVQSFSDARATEVERLIKSIEISPPVTPSTSARSYTHSTMASSAQWRSGRCTGRRSSNGAASIC